MNELLKHCRYYGGEEACPFEDSDLSWYWDMERVYVQSGGVFTGERGYFNKFVDTSLFPGVPAALLLVMFTSWGKSVQGFSEDAVQHFYALVRDYLSVASDHYPVDKIPG